eukprot:SAG11_NODE_1623_length_4559_cov_2.141480_6_plen_54_part_00
MSDLLNGELGLQGNYLGRPLTSSFACATTYDDCRFVRTRSGPLGKSVESVVRS